MKFVISATSVYDFSGLGKIVDKYPILNEYGFEILEIPDTNKVRIRDENGKPMYMETPTTKRVCCINIDTLEQLMSLCERVADNNADLVLSDAGRVSVYNGIDLPEIEIYDTWRE